MIFLQGGTRIFRVGFRSGKEEGSFLEVFFGPGEGVTVFVSLAREGRGIGVRGLGGDDLDAGWVVLL